MVALEGKAASGVAKLPPDFLFEDLPNDRSDPLWTEIRTTYNLSLAELSALKNARCQQGKIKNFILLILKKTTLPSLIFHNMIPVFV